MKELLDRLEAVTRRLEAIAAFCDDAKALVELAYRAGEAGVERGGRAMLRLIDPTEK